MINQKHKQSDNTQLYVIQQTRLRPRGYEDFTMQELGHLLQGLQTL